jgi:class 3 adenylate cyclase
VGDTVNTAKRIEGEAAPGEILASEPFRAASGGLSRGERRVQVKGKSAPLVVHTLAGLTAIKPREARA